ncbi:MAG: DUF1801 domain-containing protein [Candidatus Acidiferrales bacterium]
MARMKKRKDGGRARGGKGGRVAAKKRRGGEGAGGKHRAVTAGTRGVAAPKTFDDYLAGVADGARKALMEMRAAIRSVLPAEATEIISYRIPAFRYGPILVWYAAFAGHCSLFPTAAVIEQFKEELKGYTTSKGTIQFALGEGLPVALIKKIVKARVAAVASGKSKSG